MKKKILTIILLIIILLSVSFTVANAYNGSNFTVNIPRDYEIVNYDQEQFEIRNGNNVSMIISVLAGSYIEPNQAFLDRFTQELQSYERSIYNKKLLELNGVKGIGFDTTEYNDYVNLFYKRNFVLMSDNYSYMIIIGTYVKEYLYSNQVNNIIKSFKIKDTVTKSKGIPFIDVPTNSPYFNAIKFNNDKKFILGTTQNTFDPNGLLTRGQIVTILHRIEGYPKASSNAKKFSDVKSGLPYYDAIMWASSKGIVNGYKNGNFGPNNRVTREQLATFLKNYADYKKINTKERTDITKYKDYNNISVDFRENVSWAVAKKIIKGTENYTKINPKGNATRAQAAAMLESFYSMIK